jgi:hypothetical protein
MALETVMPAGFGAVRAGMIGRPSKVFAVALEKRLVMNPRFPRRVSLNATDRIATPIENNVRITLMRTGGDNF